VAVNSRFSRRINIDLKITSAVPKTAKQNFALVKGHRLEVTAFDVSLLGMGLISDYFLPAGLKIALAVSGESFGLKGTMKIKGEVRHCSYTRDRKYKLGVVFVKLNEEYKKAISNFIKSHEARRKPRLPLE